MAASCSCIYATTDEARTAAAPFNFDNFFVRNFHSIIEHMSWSSYHVELSELDDPHCTP